MLNVLLVLKILLSIIISFSVNNITLSKNDPEKFDNVISSKFIILTKPVLKFLSYEVDFSLQIKSKSLDLIAKLKKIMIIINNFGIVHIWRPRYDSNVRPTA